MLPALYKNLREQVLAARATLPIIRNINEKTRVAAILKIKEALRTQSDAILKANSIDTESAQAEKLSKAMIDRLVLTSSRLASLESSVQEVAEMPPVINTITGRWHRPNGLEIIQKSVPIGLIGFIFESRPNVLIDAAVLSIKSGNALILKGGREAEASNQFLGQLIQNAISSYLPRESVQIVSAADRAVVGLLLSMDDAIDLIIPRGGEDLIRYVRGHTKIPVIAHDKGLCHLYIHSDADPVKATSIVLNAKVARPGVCNSLETLLVHDQWPRGALLNLIAELKGAGVEIRADEHLLLIDPSLQVATPKDWETEYLDKIISIKLVPNASAAINHIQRYGSHHTEGICTQNSDLIALFAANVDASCIVVNASTRFNDGGELGLGPEIGISTSKLHAYGPMGAAQLTTRSYFVYGDGHCR